MNHHPFSPSSLARVAACPGSYSAALRLPNPPGSAAAQEGTDYHKAAEEALQGLDLNQEITPATLEQMRPDLDPVVAEYIVEAAKIKHLPIFAGKRLHWETERRVEIPGLLFGTSDLVAIADDGTAAAVVDLKTGAASVADAAENLQGMAYAAALAMELSPGASLAACFINPRLHEVTTAELPPARKILSRLKQIHAAAMAENAPLIDGEHCKYCPAKFYGVCPVLAGRAMAAKDLQIAATPERVEEVVNLYETLKPLAGWFKDIESRLKELVEESPTHEAAGYSMKALSAGYEINNLQEVFSIVERFGGVPSDAMNAAATVSYSKLKDYALNIAKERGAFKTKKEAQAVWEEEVKQFLNKKPPRYSLHKSK